MAATLELSHKKNINDKTISERDREVRDFNVTLLANCIYFWISVKSKKIARKSRNSLSVSGGGVST